MPRTEIICLNTMRRYQVVEQALNGWFVVMGSGPRLPNRTVKRIEGTPFWKDEDDINRYYVSVDSQVGVVALTHPRVY